MAELKRPARPVRLAERPAAQTETPMQRSERLRHEYERGLVIDKHALDDELIEHPEKLYHVGEEHVLAMSYRDEAKSSWDRTQAEEDQRIRREASGVERVTDASVKAEVATSKRVREAEEYFAKWRLLEKQWAVLLNGFEARTKALDKLSNLYTSQYWVSSSGRAVGRDARDRIADEVRKHGD